VFQDARLLPWATVLGSVVLARALVREPQLLLFDEPFGALDALTRVRMHALVQALCARYRPAVLFVTHDVDEAVLLADRVLVLLTV
jgi:sulfonate transport system ATP-binding protein